MIFKWEIVYYFTDENGFQIFKFSTNIFITLVILPKKALESSFILNLISSVLIKE